MNEADIDDIEEFLSPEEKEILTKSFEEKYADILQDLQLFLGFEIDNLTKEELAMAFEKSQKEKENKNFIREPEEKKQKRLEKIITPKIEQPYNTPEYYESMQEKNNDGIEIPDFVFEQNEQKVCSAEPLINYLNKKTKDINNE